MTRGELRHLITRGLEATEGSYRQLLPMFRLPGSDYKRLLNFLVRHGCAVDFRPFRSKGGAPRTGAMPAGVAPDREQADEDAAGKNVLPWRGAHASGSVT